jgi:hypothetical protein
MLDDEQSKRPGGLVSEIGPIQMLRYRRIAEEVRSGRFGRLYGDGNPVPVPRCDISIDKKSDDEKKFQRTLTGQGRASLLSIMGAPDDVILVTELDLYEYGRCDFVAYGGRKTWVAELKMGEAKSQVVSQIDKYRLALELDMCLGLYDEVRAYVLAERFPSYVSTELSRAGVTMVEHSGRSDSLRIIV